ncbi:MAG: excinuclease ABC subunit UvrA [Myxococcales bacterium]|nr:excinuclease ABC subunit UvrA [Myxococcales bacterium]
MTSTPDVISLKGITQNNLRGFDLDVPLRQVTVITGVSGSGKSSLAFDTLYAEGQRRYVECLSTYARQFLERMDRPDVTEITGILPTVALQQGKRLRAARSTVATLTEVSEYLKVVFASRALPTCPNGHGPMTRLQTPHVVDALWAHAQGRRAVITFPLKLVSVAAAALATEQLQRAGLHRAFDGTKVTKLDSCEPGRTTHVVIDRLKITAQDRVFESVHEALRRGDGEVDIWLEGEPLPPESGLFADLTDPAAKLTRHRASSALRCDTCEAETPDPSPNLFSWNSPVGACESCNGFGRIMALDFDRCIPDAQLSLNDGAFKPWSTARASWERGQLADFCGAAGIDMNAPWLTLPEADKQWLIDGYDPDEHTDFPGAERYYGLQEWFDWLETRTYRMHVRVLLSRYRKYVTCPACDGARLKPEALGWQLAGSNLPGWLNLPIGQLGGLLVELGQSDRAERATTELARRIALLDELGLGYLTLGRAGRTLSGGELQRVQLVTALSSGLSQVLYVLDEPSVGLHPRDNARLLKILHRLKTAGNTVVMVEHDPALIAAADHLVDLGPGAGERGGELRFSGPPSALKAGKGSLTADYLLGLKQVSSPEAERQSAALDPHDARGAASGSRAVASRARKLQRMRTQSAITQPWLAVRAPTARNLKGGRVRFRRGRLNVICGVSGSGKSTLMAEVLHRAMKRQLGQVTDAPGDHEGLSGTEGLQDVVLVEQAPVAGNSRANPATYLKLWDGIRKRLATTELATELGYTASTFSFNRPGGRCTVCDGAGVEIVDMQFLSDVRITCEACEGKRFLPEVLTVKVRGMSAADFLGATAQEIATRFADDKKLARPAQAMCELGLGYLRLGQPLGTLSGGESQRLKVAWHLLCKRTKQTLFLLDEPSTGLHLDDVRVLLGSLNKLVAAGNTVIVVEHHLDVIAAADHVVELGPEGGPGGGHLIYQGPPVRLAEVADTPTGLWLQDHLAQQGKPLSFAAGNAPDDPETLAQSADEAAYVALETQRDPGHVAVRGARVHNLRDVSVDIPRDKLTVITGLSGSGKSSLAFDVVFAEGQRRFLDCLSPYARQYLPPVSRPDVDSLQGLPPTVAIAQRTTRGGSRSTVGTLTDIASYLRLLFARCGHVASDGDLSLRTPDEVAAILVKRPATAPLYVMTPLIRGRKGFHRDVIEKAQRAGRRWIHVDGALCPIDAVPALRRYTAHDIDDVVHRLLPTDETTTVGEDGTRHWQLEVLTQAVFDAMTSGDGQVRVRQAQTTTQSFDVDPDGGGATRRASGLDPLLFSFTSARGWCPTCRGSGQAEAPEGAGKKRGRKPKKAKQSDGSEPLEEGELRKGEQDPVRHLDLCQTCSGSRLRPEALEVTIAGHTIVQLSSMTAETLQTTLEQITWSPRDRIIAEPIVREVCARAAFLLDVGLDYLGMDRSAVTLSGGESQRIRLSSQLSSNLRGVLYVLDEPTIGLHPADNGRLLEAFDRLIARGNGLLVVEHDEETILRADHVIELGPGGGQEGGRVLHAGPLTELLADPASPTGRMLHDRDLRRFRLDARPVDNAQRFITLTGARRNNLQSVTAHIARGRLNGVSGVSGSGKSTLVRDLLVGVGGSIVHAPRGTAPDLGALSARSEVDSIMGLDGFGRIVEVDQSPIGRTPRSCPATYLGIWDTIRKQFAAQSEAKVLGLKAKHFSFNVKGGRCESCQGAGVIKVLMSFLPTVYVPCETCGGARYNRQTLRVTVKGATIADVLAMSIAEAATHFAHLRGAQRALSLADQVGLGYLRLGQGSNTLSGGEAQRIKICADLAKQRRAETLYVLDEPSTGLHLADQRKLLGVLHELVDRGDTVVVIEHNLDVLKEADWLVDLGPGGGSHGGQVVYQGPVGALVDGQLQTPTAIALRA